MTNKERLESFKGKLIRYGKTVSSERLKKLPIIDNRTRIGKEPESGDYLYAQAKNGNIYKLAQSSDGEILIAPYCTPSGYEIKAKNLVFSIVDNIGNIKPKKRNT